MKLMDWLVQGEGDAAVRDDVNLGARRSLFSNNAFVPLAPAQN